MLVFHIVLHTILKKSLKKDFYLILLRIPKREIWVKTVLMGKKTIQWKCQMWIYLESKCDSMGEKHIYFV